MIPLVNPINNVNKKKKKKCFCQNNRLNCSFRWPYQSVKKPQPERDFSRSLNVTYIQMHCHDFEILQHCFFFWYCFNPSCSFCILLKNNFFQKHAENKTKQNNKTETGKWKCERFCEEKRRKNPLTYPTHCGSTGPQLSPALDPSIPLVCWFLRGRLQAASSVEDLCLALSLPPPRRTDEDWRGWRR